VEPLVYKPLHDKPERFFAGSLRALSNSRHWYIFELFIRRLSPNYSLFDSTCQAAWRCSRRFPVPSPDRGPASPLQGQKFESTGTRPRC